MTKLLQNKSIIKFLGIALSILLIVALVPQINIATAPRTTSWPTRRPLKPATTPPPRVRKAQKA